MSTSKHIDKICIAAVSLTFVLTILFMCVGSHKIADASKSMQYESTLFDTSYVHKIDIMMDDWETFIENCESEDYSACTVVIDGKKHSNIAIRAKGNTSLSSVRSMGSDDVKLKYIDDDPDSYSNIFDSAKTDISSADEKSLISALKNLSEYTDLENTLDTDEVLRYFVVHNFVVNGDSYTGSMIHNYYLHEKDGRLGMIPWDYNLAFGTFQGNSASSGVNDSIDEVLSDRPMQAWIFSDEQYTERYYELFAEFIKKWFTSDELSSMIEETSEMIRPYVEKDPTKFCTAEEFEKGVRALSEFVTLRAEAVSRQLRGDNTAVDTADLNLSDMGTMDHGH